mmetsp:Transcript_33674/g.49446  ORF Transcript_33674/g.49446 Transcript_33674/m.49446 type:complete len:86 (-) Transcript_33674:2461-2718(-)
MENHYHNCTGCHRYYSVEETTVAVSGDNNDVHYNESNEISFCTSRLLLKRPKSKKAKCTKMLHLFVRLHVKSSWKKVYILRFRHF